MAAKKVDFAWSTMFSLMGCLELSSPDLNLTPLAAFLRFVAERSEGQIELCLKSGGGLQGEKWVISRHDGDKSCTNS